ncbi:MAG TPA: cytochrome C [Deltaproteobacteria bacterium]|nr:MAG: cytochrome C [Deltaproteobacteria bacterium GWA2_45_12]HBF13993.1 cytochrome C [Deltaproteobacteria bacterium]
MLKLTDLQKKIIGLVLLLVLVGGFFLVRFLWGLGNNLGYAPDQPIPFSHKIHAGDNKIPCLYCHSNADNSKHSTIPSMNVCMNCHRVVKTESPFIQELTKTYNEGKAFEWVKVNDVPDYVYFNHKRHVTKGIDCAQCHGDVASKAKIDQVQTLQMGFCMDCHRANYVPTDCLTCHH